MARNPIPSYRKILGERVRTLRIRKGLSQTKLHDSLAQKMTLTTLSNIERAKTESVELRNLMALVDALGTTPNILLGYDPMPEIPEDTLYKQRSLSRRGTSRAETL